MPIRHFAPICHGKPLQFELKIKYTNNFVQDDSSDEYDSDTDSDTESSYCSSSGSQGKVVVFFLRYVLTVCQLIIR